MIELSKVSLERLNTCHESLQRLVHELNKQIPLIVLCGHRDKAGQDTAIAAKTSKTPWPKSKHNKIPSLAVDLLPARLINGNKINWNDKNAFGEMSDKAFTIADSMGIQIRWGGDFNQDGSKTTSDAWDLPHIELVIK